MKLLSEIYTLKANDENMIKAHIEKKEKLKQ